MLLSHADILFLDFETTGAARDNRNLPWQIGAIRMNAAQIQREQSFSLLLHVPVDHHFNPYAPGRWASIRDELAAAPTLPSLWPQLAPWLNGRILAAHHTPTERSILCHTFPLARFPAWLDTLELVRRAYPSLPNYKLESVIPALGLTDDVQALAPELAPHDAFYDACAAAVLTRHIINLPGWENATIEALLD